MPLQQSLRGQSPRRLWRIRDFRARSVEKRGRRMLCVGLSQGPATRKHLRISPRRRPAAQSRPKPRGGSTSWRDSTSMSQMALQLLGHHRGPEVFREAVEPGLILGLEVNQLLHRVAPALRLGSLVLGAAVAYSRRFPPCLEAFPDSGVGVLRCSVPWPLRNGVV